MSIQIMVVYSLIFSTGLLGLVFLGIRNERIKQERLLKQATRQLMRVSISEGTSKR